MPKVGASELINQCSLTLSGAHAPLASERIDQCSFIHSGAHAPLALERIDQCWFIHSGAHAPLALELSVLVHSFRRACTSCLGAHRSGLVHSSGAHAPARGYLGHILCWDMEKSGPTVEELPSQREDGELSLLQAAECCPATTSRHHHLQPRSLQQPPNRFLLPPMLPLPTSFSSFSKLVTNLFFLNKIWLHYRSAQKSANGFLSVLDKSICSLAFETLQDWDPANLPRGTASAPPCSLLILGPPHELPSMSP